MRIIMFALCMMGTVALFAQNADKARFEQMLQAYRNNELNVQDFPGLLSKARMYKQYGLADSIGQRYTNEYLLKLSDDSLFSTSGLKSFTKYNKKSDNRGFQYFLQHSAQVDEKLGRRGAATGYIDYIIALEEIDSKLWKNLDVNQPVTTPPDWNKMQEVITKKYNSKYAERTVTNAQVRWYEFKKDTANLIKAFIRKNELLGFDSTGIAIVVNNNYIYNLIFKKSNDPAILLKGLTWMEALLRQEPSNAGLMDTYANLLYKLNRKDEAIRWEEKAYNLASNDKEIKEAYEKMQKGEPTWKVN